MDLMRIDGISYRLEAAIDAFYGDYAAQANAERAVHSRTKALSDEIEGHLDAQFNLYQGRFTLSSLDLVIQTLTSLLYNRSGRS